jgi:hypothetical protein
MTEKAAAKNLIPLKVADPEVRRRIRAEVAERMKRNPLPSSAPKFTRDELHERR